MVQLKCWYTICIIWRHIRRNTAAEGKYLVDDSFFLSIHVLHINLKVIISFKPDKMTGKAVFFRELTGASYSYQHVD